MDKPWQFIHRQLHHQAQIQWPTQHPPAAPIPVMGSQHEGPANLGQKSFLVLHTQDPQGYLKSRESLQMPGRATSAHAGDAQLPAGGHFVLFMVVQLLPWFVAVTEHPLGLLCSGESRHMIRVAIGSSPWFIFSSSKHYLCHKERGKKISPKACVIILTVGL